MRAFRSSKLRLASVLISIILLAGAASAAVIRVKPSGNDGNSGASWVLAKKTVGAAIAAAGEGDEIWVAAGTYPEHLKNTVLNETTNPVPINVALYGGFAGSEANRGDRNWTANLTILDGGGGAVPTPPATGTVLTISGGAGPTTRVDGFVITNGHAIGGGGISIFASGPTIVNNTITSNLASVGGGILVMDYDFVPPTTSQPVITDNVITNNYCAEGGGGIAVVGQGRLVTFAPAQPLIARNTISLNISDYTGAGIGSYGHASPDIFDNWIIANGAAYDEANITGGGGGIFATSRDVDDEPISYAICAPAIVSNVISANGGYLGAGIFVWDTDTGIPTITNNTIFANNGIGIYWKTTSPSIRNNIVAFNTWGLQQPSDAPTSPTISHNCVYGNSIRGQRTDYAGIADQTGTSGNISADPGFANAAIGDVLLQPGSPCVNAGLTGATAVGWKDIQGQGRVLGNGVDIGADESDGTGWSVATPIIHVSTGGNDAQDGLSWATAKKTVGAGIAASAPTGGEVWVAQGTYTERNFLTAFVYLYGGFAGTETSRSQRDVAGHPTILDGGGVPCVLRVERAGYLVTAIDGFIIQNGGNYTGGATPGGNDGYGGRGAGIYIHVSSPLVQNNTIRHNSLGNPFDNGNKISLGAGMYMYSSFSLVKGNTFTENEALNTTDGRGGGIFSFFSMPTIEGNTFTQNHAHSGSAISAELSIPYIVRNTIDTNALYSGPQPLYMGSGEGAIDLTLGEDFLIEGNLIKGNTAAVGAGIHVTSNTAGRIENNLIINNVAQDYSANTGGIGGGIYLEVPPNATDNLCILNNTIVGNTATHAFLPPPMNEEGGGVALSLPASLPPPPTPPPAKLVMANNTIAFNSSGVYQLLAYPMLVPTLAKNDVYGSTSGANCNFINLTAGASDISLDPVFVSRPALDFHLQSTSPCKDAGDNSLIPAMLMTDYDGNPRIIDGNSDGTATVDMGAYEFKSGTDTTNPTVTITVPTSNPTFATGQSVINLGGTATDNVGITGVAWSNDRGGSGTGVGTTTWTANGVLLYPGQNVITVTASDHYPSGNLGSDVITVTYTVPTATISGHVRTSGGAGVDAVTMGGLPGSPVTDASGYYAGIVSVGWSGTVTPSRAGGTFTPPSRTYTDVAANQTNQDYVASGIVVPTISVTAPNGGETWQAGTSQAITWTSNGGVGAVKIEYSTDGGSNYAVVAASTANDGTFTWIVPNPAALSCLVKVSETDGSPSDTSDATFTITAGPAPAANQIVGDFGALGLWRLAVGAWSQMSGVNPEGMIAVNVDAQADQEAAVDFGNVGLWLWNSGAWTQLSGVNVETMAAANIDGNATSEIAADFGSVGLWLWNGGAWTQLSGVNADAVIAADVDGDAAQELVVDFGAVGLWLWNGGAWTQLSGVNADSVVAANIDADPEQELVVDFGYIGMWIWNSGSWSQVSGADADAMIGADVDGDSQKEIVADFGTLGIWLWNAGSWSQISTQNPDSLIAARLDGDADEEVVADLGVLGIWTWNGSTWSQIRLDNPDSLIAFDPDGDGSDEIAADLGLLGLWVWDNGTWAQKTPVDPDSVIAIVGDPNIN
jgi:parallel beta-helix repeat protein